MFFKSIRFKIILWYMLVLTLTLSVFSVFAYQNFKVNLYRDTDHRLEERAEGIGESIDTYWATEKMEAQRDGISVDTLTKINNAYFLRIIQRLMDEKSDDPKLLNIWVVIFDAAGHEVARSKNISGVMPLSEEAWAKVWEGEYFSRDVSFSDGSGKTQLYRVFAMPVIENAKMAYIIQIATPLNVLLGAFIRLKTIMFLLLPLTVFLTGVVGAFFAKLVLRPVEAMIRTAHQITAEKLDSRIHVPDTNDEIQQLAETFNEMLERLSRAFSFQQQFIQDVAHELKTPLTILKGDLEVTLKKTRSSQEYAALLTSNLEEVDRLSRIINDLLTLARFDSRQIQLNLIPCDLTELMKNVLCDMGGLAREKKIKLDMPVVAPLVYKIDVPQMKRVFLNIVDNAIKYTPVDGVVTVTLGTDSGTAKIKITDTGQGIPEDEIPFIFERFYRVDKSRSNSGGFGLGLSISKAICDAHGAFLSVASVLGHGTTFTISIPAT
jgi:heavy metal sensor kinase